MSYNAQAEMFSQAAKALYIETVPGALAHRAGISFPKGWSRFDQVYSDIADATPTGVSFRASTLVGQLPSIAQYAFKTQYEILLVVLRDMLVLPADCDGLVRVRAGVYRWRFAVAEAA